MDLPLPDARSEGAGVSLPMARALAACAYTVLGVILVVSRFALLGHGFWLDEAVFVQHFVRAGPREILLGGSLSHELYGVVDWATASVIGESAVAFRLWSVVPFVLGVALVTVWLHRRHDPVAGILFLFLATVSPLLLDISRQARGYGLAFLAMAVVIVAALEASRAGRARLVVVMCAAGLVGTLTLPQFGIGFLATLVVLSIDRRLRVPAAVGFAASSVLIVSWYAAHLQEVHGASQLGVGDQIHTSWIVTAPIDQIILPALFWIDGLQIASSIVWLPFVLVVIVIGASSPFFRARDDAALILCAGPVATVGALWLADADIVPRYLSFLLVPLFLLLASGAANILRSALEHKALFRSAICIVAIGLLGFRFASVAPDVIRLPREANREAARAVEEHAPRATPVYALVRHPDGLDFYLDRRAVVLRASHVLHRVCQSDRPVAYVMQPWGVPLVEMPCRNRRGVAFYRFRQYAQGREIDVWIVPPAPAKRRMKTREVTVTRSAVNVRRSRADL